MPPISRLAGRIATKSPSDIVLLSAVRSPITRAFKGGFKDAWPEDILMPVMREATKRAHIPPAAVNDVLIGTVFAELGFAKTGRMALNHAGFPVTTTFNTVNRQCSSSLQAITYLSYAIQAGQFDVGMAGGVESMTRNYATKGIPVDVSPALRRSSVKSARDCLVPMGITSENVARRYGVSREEQDEFAIMSHERAARAKKEGLFKGEIVPVEYEVFDETDKDGSGGGRRVVVDEDDSIRAGVTLEKLAGLKPAFGEDGRSTAGNSSQISDGAAAVILARRSWAESQGLKPIGRFLGTQVTGCEPDEMGIGPALAIPALYKHLGLQQSDVDIFELNEAFASQSIYCIRELDLDMSKVNPNGGAIAIGHPIGATGARQTATLMAQLERSGGKIGVVSMCASTGHGVAAAFARE